jgi:plastocyanin
MRTRRVVLSISLLSTIVLFTFAGCGSSSSTPTTPTGTTTTPTTTADVTVSILGILGNQSFAPNPISMKVGQTIAWHNSDAIGHTATGDNGGFNTGTLGSGATSSPVAMPTAGTFTYHCSIHPGMIGTIVVQ